MHSVPGRSTGFTSTATDRDDWLTPLPLDKPGVHDDADGDVDCCLALSGLGVSPRPACGEILRTTSLALLPDSSTLPASIRAVDPFVLA
jgi:hypothetical protein